MNNMEGWKESALGLIPKEWEVKQLQQVCEYVDYRGKTPPKTSEGIFLITAKNIKFGFIDYEISKEYIPEYAFESTMSRGKAEIGDVLITTEAPMGNIAQIDKEDMALAQRVIKYRGTKNTLINDFLKFYLLSESFQRLLESESTGSTVKGIKGSRLHKLTILLPPFTEQQKIAEILSTVDKVIVETQTLIAKYKAIKGGMMQDLFTQGIDTETGQLRQPPSVARHLYKESALGLIPLDWEVERLEDVCDVQFSNVDKKSYEDETPVRLCNYMDVYSNDIVTSTINFMEATAQSHEIHKFKLQKDDVLITKDSETPDDIAVPAWISEHFDNVLCGYHLAMLRPKKDRLLGFFLSNSLNISFYRKYFAALANGSTRYGLSGESIKKTPLGFPSLKEQEIIIEKVFSIISQITSEEATLKKYEQLKGGLMQDLLRGRVRVKMD
jgi:type I restriction enzyme, S subunit